MKSIGMKGKGGKKKKTNRDWVRFRSQVSSVARRVEEWIKQEKNQTDNVFQLIAEKSRAMFSG